MKPRRVGVIFGGRSGEHEVSLASAASVIAALQKRGHTVVPIGIARDGRWVVGGDPMRALSDEVRKALPGDATGGVKKSLADRAESQSGGGGALARMEPAGGLPAELRQPMDAAFVMLHGPYGEDGTIQGLLELAGVPYTGAGVLASAVGMDKVMMKTVFKAHGLPIVDHVVVLRHVLERDPAGEAARVAREIGFPCFVKPSNLGSSVGISKVKEAAALPAALAEAARHDRKLVVERGISAREIEVSVLGNDAPEASLPGEIVYTGEWYDYESKYLEGLARVVVPAPLSPELTARFRALAVQTFQAIDAAGMARVDFFLEGEDRIYVNEINTIPGFTSTSGYAKMWEATGLDYATLIDRLVELAVERHAQR
ncbi:MAG TPA: D-alanine--D-alanine ligase family protein [Terriglobales bacterium]|nr:D-alanine--D-alanine ligase family protein [Terriglobales bacterium]